MQQGFMPKLLMALCAVGILLFAGCATPVHHKERAALAPMLRIAPIYPYGAMVRNIQGTVLVCFTVKPNGLVYKPYVKSASSAAAKKYLGKAALDVISQWRFYPRVVDGKPVTTSGVCQTIDFHIQ